MKIALMGLYLLSFVAENARSFSSSPPSSSLQFSVLSAASSVSASSTAHSRDESTSIQSSSDVSKSSQARDRTKPTIPASATRPLVTLKSSPSVMNQTSQVSNPISLQSAATTVDTTSFASLKATTLNFVSSASGTTDGTSPTALTHQVSKASNNRHTVVYIVLGVLGCILSLGALGLCLVTSRNPLLRKLALARSSSPRFATYVHSSSMDSLALRGDYIRPKEEILGGWGRKVESLEPINSRPLRRLRSDYY